MAGLLLFLLLSGAAASADELTAEQAAGKRLYREGISASGAQVSARIGSGSVIVPGSTVPCGSCHGADGRGRPEGGVRPPDITWRRLSAPYGQQASAGRRHPAYNEADLVRAITEGLDPAGNPLDPAMPRFVMSSADQLSLIAYLKRLEDEADPGVQSASLRLGTLLPGDGPLAPLAATVAAVLKGALASINEAGGIHGRRLELLIADPGPDAASAEAALGRLADDGVFALVSPLVPALEDRLGPLLDKARLPLIGSLSLTGVRPTSTQIFEPLPGLEEQLQALVNYARDHLQLATQKTVLVYQPGEAGKQHADRLKQRLASHGWTDVITQVYDVEQAPLPDATPDTMLKSARAVFFLGRAQDFTRLGTELLSSGPPPYLFAASAQVSTDLWQMPPAFSGRVFVAYPFVPSDWTPEGKAALTEVRRRGGLTGEYAVLQVDAWCSVLLVAEALRQIGRNPAQEQLISALEGLHDVRTGLTPLLGFGPGRRLGMSGAHVVRVDLQQQRFELVAPYVRINAGN